MEIDFSKLEGFDWDEGNLIHIKKHKVEFSECEEVFNNAPFVLEDKTHSGKEKRLQTLGKTSSGRGLFISFTIRKNKIRPISARDQNKKERIKMNELGGEIK
jgi:uncharacterized protein